VGGRLSVGAIFVQLAAGAGRGDSGEEFATGVGIVFGEEVVDAHASSDRAAGGEKRRPPGGGPEFREEIARREIRDDVCLSDSRHYILNDGRKNHPSEG
jgi:hypothetical protein